MELVTFVRTPAGDEVVGMVLCAGLGTRLRPLTWQRPKPAVPVVGLPLLRYALALLAGAGVQRAVVNAHHLAELTAETAREAARAVGLALRVSREPIIAGTGGALREARAELEGARAIVLVNGDVLFDLDLGAALAAHAASGALATMVVMPMPRGARYASVEADAALAVRRIAGFGPGGEDLTPWHFTGVHVLSPRLIEEVPREPFEVDVNRQVYPPLLGAGLVQAHLATGYWNDLGAPHRYLAANLDLLSGRIPLGRFPGADPFAGCRSPAPGLFLGPGAKVASEATLLAPAYLGAGATVEPFASVGPSAVVGAGATVSSRARVARAVLWEGTSLAPGEEVVEAVAAGGLRLAASAEEGSPGPTRP